MRYLSFAGLAAQAVLTISVCLPQFASAKSVKPASPTPAAVAKSKSAPTYEVTLIDAFGTETQSLSVPAGTPMRVVDMVGGYVEIAPAKSASAPSALSFYANVRGMPALLHSAKIVASPEKPVQVAYLLCGAAVTYYSPRPAKLPKCDASTVTASQP